jgi:hypothetical protein
MSSSKNSQQYVIVRGGWRRPNSCWLLGIIEQLLNIGLCDATLPGLLRQTGNPCLVCDTYRHLVASHGEVVGGVPASVFDAEGAAFIGMRDERDLELAELRDLTRRCLEAYANASGTSFPRLPFRCTDARRRARPMAAETQARSHDIVVRKDRPQTVRAWHFTLARAEAAYLPWNAVKTQRLRASSKKSLRTRATFRAATYATSSVASATRGSRS